MSFSKTRLIFCSQMLAMICLLLCPFGPAKANGAFPWSDASPPPAMLANVLGESPPELIGRLGAPTHDQAFSRRRSAEFVLYYKSLGESFVGSAAGGVSMVVFCDASAGNLDGVRVGDAAHGIVARWGKPPVIAGPVAIYRARNWLLEAELDPTRQSLALMAVMRRGSSLAHEDGELMLDEFCPHVGGLFPWRAGDTPPAVAGINLGAHRDVAEAVLGAPQSDRPPGGKPGDSEYFLNYPQRGLTLIGMPADGISVILMTTPEAGSIDGLRVGDSVNTLLDHWGIPPDQNGPLGIYNAGVWGVVTKLDPATMRIKSMYLAWTERKWPDIAGKKPDRAYRLN